MTTIINVGGNDYRIGRLSVMQQYHVGRRLAPIIFLMGAQAVGLVNADGTIKPPEQATLVGFMPMLGMFSDVLSKMSDEDSERVIFECMSAVHRKAGADAWQVVVTQGRFMYEDIDLPTMVRLVFAVVWEHLPGFFKELGGSAPTPSS